MRFICAILLALSLVVSGCGSADRGPDVGASLSTAEGMGEYLQSVPAVKHVEPWQNDFAAGIQITTEHYEIYTTLLEPLMLRQLPGFPDQYHFTDLHQPRLTAQLDDGHRIFVHGQIGAAAVGGGGDCAGHQAVEPHPARFRREQL